MEVLFGMLVKHDLSTQCHDIQIEIVHCDNIA